MLISEAQFKTHWKVRIHLNEHSPNLYVALRMLRDNPNGERSKQLADAVLAIVEGKVESEIKGQAEGKV